MSNVFIDFAGIFHVKDDLFRFIDTMEDHQKVLIFTINSENDFKNVLRIETSGIQKLLMQIGIPANMLGFSYIVTALELIALDPDYYKRIICRCCQKMFEYSCPGRTKHSACN